MKNILFEKIIDINKFDELPSSWEIPNIKKYSFKRTLFDYQEKAMKYAILGLYKYYEDIEDYSVGEKLGTNDIRKSVLFDVYKSMYDGDIESAAGQKRRDSKYGFRDEVFEIYEKYFGVEEDTISFKEFTNRMNFWMSTASGKSLVIIKLIQILGILMDRGEIPKSNIMLLAPRNDLLNQLKDELEDFNLTPGNPQIRLVSLKEFKGKKTNAEQMSMSFSNEITVYYYRSDNFIESHDTDAMLNYAQRINDGKWYVILDEAHRGDSGDSKMKAYFSAFAKNGFLFNFSATFTDEIDKITTIYNFNLKKFLEAGYGKKIYVSKSEFDDFRGKLEEDEVIRNKKKIVLKGLITLTYLKKCYEELSNTENVYHSPMMLTLVNTVNKSKYETEPDLLLYFKEIMDIGQNGCDTGLFMEARMELIDEFNKGQYMYKMGDVGVNTNKVSSIGIEDIYKYIYNSQEKGEIEISYSKDNENEAAFFLKTSENISPFCIVRIGEAKKWIKDNLAHLTIVERYEDKRYFENIDKYEDVNILMGSRAFYEGWDSLRPNIINYINIGTQAQSQKYVLQSLGRGIRIQPIKGERKRIDEIRGEEVLKKLNPIKQDSTLLTYGHSLESLFVFATDKNVLEKV
ncbi:MAG TPA: DEAD/DEAH box helicase family protein, partial [Thermoanaerobacterales bacterium]|nr:DEAD/DEAH box helicase family protein [Thermoanaerobacterales bacterium]